MSFSEMLALVTQPYGPWWGGQEIPTTVREGSSQPLGLLPPSDRISLCGLGEHTDLSAPAFQVREVRGMLTPPFNTHLPWPLKTFLAGRW